MSAAPKASPPSLEEGHAAPAWSLQNQDGETVRLADLKGKKVVLYFYPKDDTPGCTKEACAFRDGFKEMKMKGAEVFGISADDVDSHKKFHKKYSLNFPLLSDPDKKMIRAHGVWKEKSMYGKTHMGIERTTFVINEQGKIAKIFPRVKVEKHFAEVLDALERLGPT